MIADLTTYTASDAAPHRRLWRSDIFPVSAVIRFAVIGDTKSVGTFERIAEQLRREALDFAVLLDDVSFMGKESYHRYLRAELAETDLEVPTYYVVGNHVVDPDTFPKGGPFLENKEI